MALAAGRCRIPAPRPRSLDVADDPIFALKRQLADAILRLSAGVFPPAAARRFGIDPARMRDLSAGRIARFSVERLIRILATVDCRVTVDISAPAQEIVWYPALRARRDARMAAFRAEAARRRSSGADY
jgi:predicted XRE-type DNA-binding protein